VRAQLPGLGIDDLELFLHADGEPVGHGGMIAQGSGVQKVHRVQPPSASVSTR
jgi:hypothetical protein